MDSNKKKTLLLVEDESIVAMTLRLDLEDMGYEVPLSVSKGKEALDNIKKIGPDLVLIDISLKGEMDGIETARIIKERFNIPIIFISGFFDESNVVRAKEVDPEGFIAKPYIKSELQETIKNALKNR